MRVRVRGSVCRGVPDTGQRGSICSGQQGEGAVGAGLALGWCWCAAIDLVYLAPAEPSDCLYRRITLCTLLALLHTFA